MPKHVRKGDQVVVTQGSDKGKVGEVLPVIHKGDRVLVKGIEHPHQAPQADPAEPQGRDRHQQEIPIHISNVSPVVDGKPTRVRFVTKTDGTKVRVAARGGKEIGKPPSRAARNWAWSGGPETSDGHAGARMETGREQQLKGSDSKDGQGQEQGRQEARRGGGPTRRTLAHARQVRQRGPARDRRGVRHHQPHGPADDREGHDQCEHGPPSSSTEPEAQAEHPGDGAQHLDDDHGPEADHAQGQEVGRELQGPRGLRDRRAWSLFAATRCGTSSIASSTSRPRVSRTSAA